MQSDYPPREALGERETLRFATRIDRWLAVVAGGYVLLAVGLPAWHLGNVFGGGAAFNPLLAVLPPLILALVWAVAVPCTYELRGLSLVAHSGMIAFAIPLLAITRVRRTRTVISAPAWSLQRLEISYGKTQRLIISPEREAEFLRELKLRAPQLVWVGDELVVAQEWIDAGRKAQREQNRRGTPGSS
ncbi:MAG: PH domain-containing protein [Bryobacterales bacterium]|nr:PH domain-containing protein [Bryobacterales bacterium]